MIFVKNLPKAKQLLRACIFIFFAKCATACTLFEAQKPSAIPDSAGQLVSLNWSGLDGAIYRVQIIANTPEGGVFWSLDTQIKERVLVFKLPSNQAVLKVQISKNCDDANLHDIQTLQPIAMLSEKKSCSIAIEDWFQEGQLIKFKPRSNIQNYLLSLYEVIDIEADNLKTKLLKKIDVKAPQASLIDDKVAIDMQEKFNISLADADQKYFVSVLPKCAEGLGLPLAIRLSKT